MVSHWLDVGAASTSSPVVKEVHGLSSSTVGVGILLAWASLGVCALLLRVPFARGRRRAELKGSPSFRYRTLVFAFLGAAAMFALPSMRERSGGLLGHGWQTHFSLREAAPLRMAADWVRPLVAASSWPASPIGRALSALAMLWAGVVAISLARTVYVHARSLRRCRLAVDAPPFVRARAAMVARRLGMKVPELSVSHQAEVPFAMGLLSPRIILPKSDLESLSTEQLDYVIHHEMVHIQRGDLRTAFVVEIARLAFTGHPLRNAFVSEIAYAREASVDARVASDSPLQYASFLLELAHRISIQSHMKGTLPMADSNLSRRIALLLSRAAHAPTRGQKRVAVALVAAGIAAATCVWLAPTSWAAPSAAAAEHHCDAGVTATE